MGYSVDDKPYPRGEILVKTNEMVVGYFKDEKHTNESFINGWFKTGDIGQLQDGTFGTSLKIIGRRKNFFKLEQGEFVSPVKIENILIQSRFIDYIYIYGDSSREFLVAIIVPVESYYCGENQLYEEQLKKDILTDCFVIATQNRLQSFEIPKAIYTDYEKFTTENGLLTSSFKQCRPKLFEKYHLIIEELYETSINKTNDDYLRAILNDAGMIIGEDNTINIEDSLTAVKVVKEIEDKYGSKIPVSKLYGGLNISDISDIIQNTDEEDIDTQLCISDSKLYENIAPNIKEFSDSTTSILITGATGFVGSNLLSHIVETLPNCKLYCLVRGHSQMDGVQRLINVFNKYHLFERGNYENIEIVVGDLSKELFGFTEQKYNYLSNIIDTVIHCASEVNWLKSYSQLRKGNVLGCIEIIRFCVNIKNKKLLHTSSIGISDYHEESVQNVSVIEHFSGYMQTKWVCEKNIIGAMNTIQDFKCSIIRLGMVTGNEYTGVCNTQDFVSRYLLGINQLNYYIPENKILDMTPVNIICAAIYNIITYQGDKKMFNMYNPNSLSYQEIGEAAINSGIQLEPLEYGAWRKLLLVQPQNPLYRLLSYFPEEGFRFGMRKYDIINSKEIASLRVLNKEDMFDLIKTYYTYLNDTVPI
eukprot:TRINITY_DN9371_c0_g1_i2.p1 TRINITY_DN9371_c0_g1~~TRINITY_DN9371_c0_g1_i2.p1  ORF type:complete len:645 (-),score=129.90 TRINITY_DN9371_c0_g1_i2:21-1955(-)